MPNAISASARLKAPHRMVSVHRMHHWRAVCVLLVGPVMASLVPVCRADVNALSR
jgi:hypothetical protein